MIGRSHEIKFWDSYYRTKGLEWADKYGERFDASRPLHPRAADLLEKCEGASLTVLDVGAGPMTFLSKGGTSKQIEIVAVDPLAEDYDRILRKYNVKPPIRTQKVQAEHLLKCFPENSFDLVTARNAIDHCFNPIRAISEMVAVAKSGSFVLLEHRLNEAIHENWKGLHQWNFGIENNKFIIRSRSALYDVAALLHGSAILTWKIYEQDWLVVWIQKCAT